MSEFVLAPVVITACEALTSPRRRSPSWALCNRFRSRNI